MAKIRNILFFYIDGFKNMSKLARQLWVIIIVKLMFIFVVVKVFLMPNAEIHYKSEKAHQEAVLNSLLKHSNIDNQKLSKE